jgi:hypothetical protein
MTFPTFSSGEVLRAQDMNAVGMWRVGGTSFASTAAVVVDNVFTSDYRNYRVVVDSVGVSTGNTCRLTYLNSSGVEQTSGYFSGLYWFDYATPSATVNVVGGSGFITVMYLPSNNQPGGSSSFDITTPNITTEGTHLTGNHAGVNAGVAFAGGFVVGTFQNTTAMRGFMLRSALGTNMTGSVSVYGYK